MDKKLQETDWEHLEGFFLAKLRIFSSVLFKFVLFDRLGDPLEAIPFIEVFTSPQDDLQALENVDDVVDPSPFDSELQSDFI